MNLLSRYLSTKLGVVVMSLLLFAIPASCQDSKYDSGIPVPIYQEGCNSLMTAMHRQWQESDGELGIVFCKQLIWGLLLEPNAFYEEFSKDTISYNRFLDCVEYDLFMNFNDTTTAPLDRLKQAVIDRLSEKTYSIDSSYIKLHEELIDKIKHVEPTFVD